MGTKIHFTLHIAEIEAGAFLVQCPQLPELNSRHETLRECVKAGAAALNELQARGLGRMASVVTGPAAQACRG